MQGGAAEGSSAMLSTDGLPPTINKSQSRSMNRPLEET